MTDIITPENYHDIETQRACMSSHQWSDWLSCAFATGTALCKETKESPSTAILVGAYTDIALLTPDLLPAWLDEHPEVMTKAGALRADYENANVMVARLQRDPVVKKLLNGEHQWIVTGEIGGMPWRGMLDVIQPEKEVFVDLKTVGLKPGESLVDKTEYDRKAGVRLPWYDFWGYWRQMAVYRELIRQQYDKQFRPIILAVSKPTPASPEPDIAAFSFEDDARLDEELEDIKQKAAEVELWRNETDLSKLPRCENCAACRATKIMPMMQAQNRGLM